MERRILHTKIIKEDHMNYQHSCFNKVRSWPQRIQFTFTHARHVVLLALYSEWGEHVRVERVYVDHGVTTCLARETDFASRPLTLPITHRIHFGYGITIRCSWLLETATHIVMHLVTRKYFLKYFLKILNLKGRSLSSLIFLENLYWQLLLGYDIV